MKFFIDTSDNRLKIILNKLQKQNYETVEVYEGSTKLAKAGDVFIFSPVKKFASTEIQNFPNSITIFAGVPLDDLTQICKEKNIKFINYLSYEPFSIKNANLTSEGILAKILELSPKSIYENHILILGYGRCGKALSQILSKLNVDFAICDYDKNNYENAFFIANRVYFKDEFYKDISKFDIIINTIPHQLIDDETALKIDNDAIYLEIASVQSLSDKSISILNYHKLPALPSKFCPLSASNLIYEIIKSNLNLKN